MALVCPPKHTIEWKKLVAKVGSEFTAFRYWLANKEEIPNDDQIEKFGLTNKPIPVKFQALVTNIQQKINALKSKEASLWGEHRSAIGKERLTKQEEIKKIQNKIVDLEKDVDELIKQDALENIKPYAESQLEEVEQILNKKQINFHDLTSVARTIALWKKAGQINKDHIFFNESELESSKDEENETMQEIKANFLKWGHKAESLSDLFQTRAVELLTSAATNHYGNDAQVDFTRIMKDIGITRALCIDISEADNTLYQLMSSWIKESTYNAHTEVLQVAELTDKIMEGLTKKGYNLNDVFELFRQTQANDDARYTGNATFRFTQAFFNNEKEQSRKLKEALENAKNSDPILQKKIINNAIKSYYTTKKKQEIAFDVRKLFPDKELYPHQVYNNNEIESHKQELISQLGNKGYAFYEDRAKTNIENYKELYEAEKSVNEQRYLENPIDFQMAMELFEKTYSPYYVAEAAYEEVAPKVGGQYVSQNRKYSQVVPRKTINGKDTGFYDSKFEKIEADENILGLYNFFMDTKREMDSYLPEHEKEDLQINSIPEIAKTIVEKYTTAGINQGLTPLLDLLKTSLRTDESSTESSDLGSDVNGRIEKVLQTNFIKENKSKILDYINMRSVEAKIQGTKRITSQDLIEWGKIAQDKFARDKSYDFGKIIKAYSHAALLYKHKARIEDAMNVANIVMDHAVEQQVNAAGEGINRQYGDPKTKVGLSNMKNQLEATMKYFYGYKFHKIEGQTKVKAYTKEEEITKSQLETLKEQSYSKFLTGTFSQKDFLTSVEKIDIQIDKIGGFYAGNKMADMLLKYIQLKGMGWNIFAGFCNVAFGTPSNYIEASSGQRFNVKDLNAAYKIALTTIGGENTQTGKKVISLMKKFNVLKETRNELDKSTSGTSSFSWFGKNFKWLNPYQVQAKTEYMNQSPVLIAMMLHTKVKNAEGKEVSMWEAYDEEGKIKENYIENETPLRFKERVDEAISVIHGNYDPDKVIAGKQYTVFRAATQFKTWALMGFYDRFGERKYSHVAGFYKEGRYKAYNHLYSEYGAIEGTIILTKELIRKILFQKNTFEKYETLDETDIANLRRNLTEIITFTSIMAAALITKALMSGDDPDDKERKRKMLALFPMYALINSLNRVGNDLTFYTNPMSFQQLQSNIIPAFSFVTDAQKLLISGANILTGGDDIYHGGRNSGDSKFMHSARKLTPGLVMIDRLKSLNAQIWSTSK